MQTTSQNGPRRRALLLASRRAFSLLEISLVIAIIGVLMAVAAVNVLSGADKAKRRATVQSMNTIDGALKGYRLDENTYPPTLSVLVDTGYLDAPVPRDGWKQDFYYAVLDQGRAYSLRSLGADGLPSTEDDIDAALELTK